MRKLIFALSIVFGVIGCTSIDCPMNSYVAATYAFYATTGEAVKVTDTLTISTNRRDGNDTVLVNRQTEAHSVRLPMSYNAPVDTLLFTISSEAGTVSDFIFVEKTNDMHFESVDCGTSFFHNIISASSTHNFIDTVKVANKSVNYDSSPEHILIFVH